ncbi:MAG: diphosphomevalonate decarboxylase [Gammaproteobacteria bacterium]|nr:diphosphomevalonate decarboxylase [Gammaproteobacteria bacterium]
MKKLWFAQAPSNIALIKYMGKTDYHQNLPTNPSLSYTLPALLSYVELEHYPGHQDCWEPLLIPGFKSFSLSDASQKRFLNHLSLIKDFFNYEGHFIVRSANNFPLASGLASSASSFAALTKCAANALSELCQQTLPDTDTLASWSRLGSGSSCRSFYSPWALWDEQHVAAIELPYPNLIHHVIIISDEEKIVSSKTAHLAIQSSPEFLYRPGRARERLKDLIIAMKNQDWLKIKTLCWEEFMDMHHLFETSTPSFQYINDNAKVALKMLEDFWETHQDGPIVTMDAGPNIHLLFRPDQKALLEQLIQEKLINQYDYL